MIVLLLSTANKIMHRRLNEMHMRNGVTFIDSDTTYIDEGVVIGSDIGQRSHYQRKTVIGEDCLIGAHSEIVDSHIGNQVVVKQSVIEESVVREGPMWVRMHIYVLKQMGQTYTLVTSWKQKCNNR